MKEKSYRGNASVALWQDYCTRNNDARGRWGFLMDTDHYAKLKPLIEFNIELPTLVKERAVGAKNVPFTGCY